MHDDQAPASESEKEGRPPRRFTAAELGAIAHLYRGEVYRSTIWRTRLDNTTNWAVVTLGVALSITFSSAQSSPVPLVLVGVLIMFFLALEARRYRYFNVWRARARWMETHLFAPMLADPNWQDDQTWQPVLAEDYHRPHYHISLGKALGRRIRRNYLWILMIQSLAYIGKLVVHPTPLDSMAELLDRAAIGPVPGWLILALGLAYNLCWIVFALVSWQHDRLQHGARPGGTSMG